jgi:hypothetical protein
VCESARSGGPVRTNLTIPKIAIVRCTNRMPMFLLSDLADTRAIPLSLMLTHVTTPVKCFPVARPTRNCVPCTPHPLVACQHIERSLPATTSATLRLSLHSLNFTRLTKPTSLFVLHAPGFALLSQNTLLFLLKHSYKRLLRH